MYERFNKTNHRKQIISNCLCHNFSSCSRNCYCLLYPRTIFVWNRYPISCSFNYYNPTYSMVHFYCNLYSNTFFILYCFFRYLTFVNRSYFFKKRNAISVVFLFFLLFYCFILFIYLLFIFYVNCGIINI